MRAGGSFGLFAFFARNAKRSFAFVSADDGPSFFFPGGTRSLLVRHD
jgi:hypothetical protein